MLQHRFRTEMISKTWIIVRNWTPNSCKLIFKNSKLGHNVFILRTFSDAKKSNLSEKHAEIKQNVAELKNSAAFSPEKKMEKLSKLKEKILDLEKEINVVVPKIETEKKRTTKPMDTPKSSLERNFLTPSRALREFLLKPADIENLPKTKRRSPYENQPTITVYWRKDVEAKAIEVWSSLENLRKEQLRKEILDKRYHQDMFMMKKRLRDFRREKDETASQLPAFSTFRSRSGRVVILAVTINCVNFLLKLFGWIHTGSHSMFSECIHSLADTINQIILAYGVHKSVQIPDSYHPYGYSNMKYVASLISGVGIFCLGTGLSLYHGISGLVNPVPIGDFHLAFIILGSSFVTEGITFLIALNSVLKGAKEMKLSVKDYVLRGQDPSVNVVLMEDFAAVIGVSVASACMWLSIYNNSPIPDAIGSLLVGGLLGCVASFIIYSNVAALVGRSIPHEIIDKINAELESDIMVRAIHDVKGIDMGNNLVRYKAEVDFDSRELAQCYLDKQDLDGLLAEVKKFEKIDELEIFLLRHGERIVDTLGLEIDRIESKLKKNHPKIRHIDLEIL